MEPTEDDDNLNVPDNASAEDEPTVAPKRRTSLMSGKKNRDNWKSKKDALVEEPKKLTKIPLDKEISKGVKDAKKKIIKTSDEDESPEMRSEDDDTGSIQESTEDNIEKLSLLQDFATNLGLPSIISSIAKIPTKDANKIKPKLEEIVDVLSRSGTPLEPIFKGLLYMFNNQKKMRRLAKGFTAAELSTPSIFAMLGELGNVPSSVFAGVLDVINEVGLSGIKMLGSGSKNIGRVTDTAFENVKDIADTLMGFKNRVPIVGKRLSPLDDFVKLGLNTAHATTGGVFESVGTTLNKAAKDGREEAAAARDRRRRSWPSRRVGTNGMEDAPEISQ